MVSSLGGRGGLARSATGGSFQLASEGIEDNRLASDWLAARGFTNPIVIGHSNGGMLAAPSKINGVCSNVRRVRVLGS
jgi:hypothetical protein